MAAPICLPRWRKSNASSIEPRAANRAPAPSRLLLHRPGADHLGRSVRHARRRSILARLADKAELQVVDVGQPGGQNVAVTRVAVAEGVVTVDHPTRIDMEVENFGNQDRTQHTVEVLVDGQRIAEEHLDIPAGGRSSVAVVHAFPIPGEHIVEVHSAEDRLEVDNHRWLSLEVRPALEVLCVEGRSGAAKNVVFALEPGASAQARVRPYVQSEIALLEEDLNRYDCIFLCNVGRFGRDEALLLRRFLEQGGGIVMFLGDQVQAANYNSILGAEAGGLAAPAGAGGRAGSVGRVLLRSAGVSPSDRGAVSRTRAGGAADDARSGNTSS